MADRIVIWRFREVTYGLTRKETEFLRDCLVAHSKADWLRLGVWLRRALNAPETALPVEFSPFDVPALRGVLDGVMVGSSGLAALQHDVGARPHPDDPSARVRRARSDRSHKAPLEQESDEPLVVWNFGGVTDGLNRREAELLRDWLLVAPNLAWIALGERLREALGDANGGAPVELTLSDVHVVRGVLDAAPLGDNPGLAALKRATDPGR